MVNVNTGYMMRFEQHNCFMQSLTIKVKCVALLICLCECVYVFVFVSDTGSGLIVSLGEICRCHGLTSGFSSCWRLLY